MTALLEVPGVGAAVACPTCLHPVRVAVDGRLVVHHQAPRCPGSGTKVTKGKARAHTPVPRYIKASKAAATRRRMSVEARAVRAEADALLNRLPKEPRDVTRRRLVDLDLEIAAAVADINARRRAER